MNEKLFHIHQRLGKHAFAYNKKLPPELNSLVPAASCGICMCGAVLWDSGGLELLWGAPAIARVLMRCPHMERDVYEHIGFMRSLAEEDLYNMLGGNLVATDWEILAVMHAYGMPPEAAIEYLGRMDPGWEI